jgi:hypothetical protein
MADDAAGRAGLSYGLIDRFVPVGPSDYDDIRSMLAATEAVGFTDLR